MDINDLISESKELKGLEAEPALELFNSDEPLDFAEKVRRSSFSSATTISAALVFTPEQTLAGLKLRACELAACGHRRILLKMEDIGDHSPAETVDSLLSIERKRDNIRRVDLKLPGNVGDVVLDALKESDAAVILPADSDAPLLAKSVGIDDIGLSMHFTADGCLDQLEILLHRADEITPRIIEIDRDDSLPPELFERICQIIRLAKPWSALMIGSDEDLALAKFATTLLLAPDEKLDKFVNKMIRASMLPSFCAACRLENRTGETFVCDCKSGKMHNCCYLNALISLKEFLSDFGSQDTRIVGTDMVLRELYSIKNDQVRALMVKTIKDMRNGERGFHV